jgi:hypothetical protein
MKNLRNLLAAAVLAATAACSGDATAPEAARHPSRPSLDIVVPDTSTTSPLSEPGTQDEGVGDPKRGGLIGSSG